MSAPPTPPADRLRAGIGVALVHGLIAFALLRGLAGQPPATHEPEPRLIDVPIPPPPPRHRDEQPHARRRSGAAAPPNLRTPRAEIVEPRPIIPLVLPPPVVTAPAGASDRAGPGSGAGGQGQGTGSGREGNGEGAGGDFSPPRQIRGRLRFSDYPRTPGGEPPRNASVGVRYRVGINGRASDCSITRSSGNPQLDRTTCRLIEQRFRFDPSLDPDGRPVPSILVENHSWIVQPATANGPAPDEGSGDDR